MLHHQIPHVDFSSLRPVGFAYLHIAELLINKEYTLLISRFIFWLEMSLIAYGTMLLIYQQIKLQKDSTFYYCFLIVFIFNVHYFPIEIWHTVDGLLFALLGFICIQSKNKWKIIIGSLFIGYASICKQGFVVLIPLSILLYWKHSKLVLVSLSIPLLYILYIYFNNGIQDLLIQFSTQHDLLQVGCLKYILSPYLYFGIVLYFIYSKTNSKLVLTLLKIIIPSIALLLLITEKYHSQALFYLFGFIIADFILNKKKRTISIILLALAWTASISIGYNSIALFGGSLLVYSLITINKKSINIKYILLILNISLVAFVFVRYQYIYRDFPKSKLKYRLDNVVEGGKGIYTNQNTYEVLKELHQIKQTHQNVITLPDFMVCNIYQSHLSPIATDWPNTTEVPNQNILNKVILPLKNTSKKYTFALAKYQTALLKDGFTPINNQHYLILDYIQNNYSKIDTTKYFILYQ